MNKRRVGNPKHNYSKEWKRFRREFGFTQCALASTLGITQRTVWNIENKMTRPNISTRTRFRELVARHKENQWQPNLSEFRNPSPATKSRSA